MAEVAFIQPIAYGPYEFRTNQSYTDGFGYLVELWCGTKNGATFAGTKMSSIFSGEGREWRYFDSWAIQQVPDLGTYQLRIFGLRNQQIKIRDTYPNLGTVLKYDSIQFTLYGFADQIYGTFFVPSVDINNGTAILWLGSSGRTYTDIDFATVACGTLSTREFSDTISATDALPKSSYKELFDVIPFTENMRWSPRQIKDTIFLEDLLETTSIRHGTITDWLFKPDYKVFFGLEGTYATTNWHSRINGYSSIRKSIRHWTGEFEFGNWNPQLIDEYSELYGSFYGSEDGRYKEIILKAMINTEPLTYVSQFSGELQRTTWKDGVLSLDIKDKLRDLPNRTFVFDYENIGSIAGNKKWGVVTRVNGTNVMFDDYGDEKWIERKTPGVSIWNSILSAVVNGITGFIGGKWVGLALGGLSGYFGNPPQSEQTVGGYYKVEDFNMIPDDLIKSGARLKFYAGSISGIATNLNHPLVEASEKSISGGTFIRGIHGTVEVEDVYGIHVGDFIYVRKPLFFQGSPNEVIKGILCGSNIDYPYIFDKEMTVDTRWFGVWTFRNPYYDFNVNWNSELESLDLVQIGKFISYDDNSTPFDEIKEIANELQISFFIDEDNRFSVKTIKPRSLIRPTSIATYTQSLNILDGFEFTRSTDDALFGLRLYYDYVGSVGAFRGGYNRSLVMKAKNPLTRNNQWGTIESKWLHSDIDAKVIGWRTLNSLERGMDKITIPTTLYGVIHSLSDVINVYHPTGSQFNKLYEIESYDKDFGNSSVTIEAINVDRTHGYGNCKWSGTSIPITTGSQSGFSYVGIIGAPLSIIGTIVGTLLPNGTLMVSSGVAPYPTRYINHFVAFGSLSSKYTEICLVTEVSEDLGTYHLKRGLFNTISRPIFAYDFFYNIGWASFNPVTGEPIVNSNLTGKFRLGTSRNINTNIGTAFRFF